MFRITVIATDLLVAGLLITGLRWLAEWRQTARMARRGAGR